MNKKYVALAAIPFLLAWGCSTNQTPRTAVDNTVTTIPAPVLDQDYMNKEFGFSMKLPQEWKDIYTAASSKKDGVSSVTFTLKQGEKTFDVFAVEVYSPAGWNAVIAKSQTDSSVMSGRVKLGQNAKSVFVAKTPQTGVPSDFAKLSSQAGDALETFKVL